MVGLKPKDPPNENTFDPEVHIWDDPIWVPALRALTDAADPKPIATLMRNGDIPPFEVLEQLAIMLDPPKGYLGDWLEIRRTKKDWRKAAMKLGKEREIRARIAELAQQMQVEAAIAQVMAERKLSRAKVFQIWTTDDYEIVRRSQEMLGHSVPAKSLRKKR